MSEFLAEARILVRPDTTRFRRELEAQLATAVGQRPVTIPVQAAFAGSTGPVTAFAAAQNEATTATLGLASAQNVENQALARGAVLLEANAVASQREAAAAEAAGAARQQNLAVTRALTAQQNLAATAAQKLAFTQAEVAGAATEVSAAQVVLTRSTAAVAAAERASGAALEVKNIALIDAASQSLRLANAQAAEAETALLAARAQAQHASSLGAVGTAGIASTASMLGLRGAVLTAGAAFLGATIGFQAFARSVGLAIDLERELNVFQITAGATADQMERVAETARDLGRDITLPGVAAQDAAQTMAALARAGLDVQDAIDARGTLQLATAAQIDNAKATELVANALNSFQLSGTEATRVADLLAGAANASQGSIEDMGLALRQVAAVARLVGLSVDETVTFLTQLSRAGLSSSDAGTSLRTTLLRLIGDFPKVSREVERLGLTLRDTSGEIRPEFFAELGERLRRMSPAARQATLALLGGSDAIRAISILSRSSAEDFRNLENQISRTGIAQEVAAAQTKGLGGDVEATKNELADMGTTIGQLSSGPISLFVRTVGAATGAVNDLAQAARDTDQGFGETFGNFVNRFSESFARLNINFQQGVRLATSTRDNFSVLARTTDTVTTAIDGLADALGRLGQQVASTQGTPQDTGLGVTQILNRLEGLDAEEVRARISGNNAQILAVLQQQQDFLESQLQRQFVRNRPALRRELEQALLGTVNDISAIAREGQTAARNAAREAQQAREEADRALLGLLSNRRQDAERSAAAAAQTEGLQDDIRAQDRIQALIRAQIAKVRESIRDEQLRRETIRELRIALIASRREEDALRAQQAQNRAAARQEGIQLDIEFAEITENTAREIAARQRLIALLKKQQAAVKRGTAEWKRLRNEIAEQQQAIKEARGQAEEGQDEGRRAAEFFFEQLQAQQGFAANLLGNLIPRDQTAGLVGVPAPPSPGRQIQAEARAAAGRAQTGPTSGQVSATNDILLRILEQLKSLNNAASAPEAVYQKKMGAAAMSGGGGNVEAM